MATVKQIILVLILLRKIVMIMIIVVLYMTVGDMTMNVGMVVV